MTWPDPDDNIRKQLKNRRHPPRVVEYWSRCRCKWWWRWFDDRHITALKYFSFIFSLWLVANIQFFCVHFFFTFPLFFLSLSLIHALQKNRLNTYTTSITITTATNNRSSSSTTTTIVNSRKKMKETEGGESFIFWSQKKRLFFLSLARLLFFALSKRATFQRTPLCGFGGSRVFFFWERTELNWIHRVWFMLFFESDSDFFSFLIIFIFTRPRHNLLLLRRLRLQRSPHHHHHHHDPRHAIRGAGISVPFLRSSHFLFWGGGRVISQEETTNLVRILLQFAIKKRRRKNQRKNQSANIASRPSGAFLKGP